MRCTLLAIGCIGFFLSSAAFGADHPADGARVVNVGAVGPDMLGIELQSGEFKLGGCAPYAAQPGDALSGGKKAWVVRDGKMVEELLGQVVSRKNEKGEVQRLGVLSFSGKSVLGADKVVGTQLDPATVAEPASYEIQSSDDAAFAKGAAPSAAYRKSKPNSPGGLNSCVLHRVYLKLPAPLKEGATYTVRFKGLTTREETVLYKHDTWTARSDAIHVTRLGYRPDDPFKRGYVSLWMGTGGAQTFEHLDSFELVDAQSGKTVFTGKADAAPAGEKPYTMAPVFWLDFTAFPTPGTFRVRVPGIGVSVPFSIAENVWDSAFKIGMRGVLSQRSGIALGPPFLEFKRPRPSHPDDGVKFYQTDIHITDGQEGPRGEALLRLWKANGKLDEVSGVWGGYQDAGDWDTYTTTLAMADLLTEAFELSPEFAKAAKLSLPPDEANNKIPDLLDEALWGLSAFKRLQLPSGAVRDGFGDGWGARDCDLSWDDSNPVCVYAASRETSWRYASIAARMAALLTPYDAAQAGAFKASALKAWQWAEAEPAVKKSGPEEDHKAPAWFRQHAIEAAAAVALFALTQEPAYHERFKQICEIQDVKDIAYAGGWIEPMQQADATFLYACLPDKLADPALKEHARKLYVLAGNVAAHFMKNNPYNLATAYPGIPQGEFCSYFTNPGMGVHAVRAHYLTHDPQYLEAIVASTGFGLGANPDNLSYTTGIGSNTIHYPLKLDSLRTGQPPPVGITVFGPSDLSKLPAGENWLLQWFLPPTRMTPNAKTWPPAEGYADIFNWAGGNEYCVNTPLGNATYVWCYLAGQK